MTKLATVFSDLSYGELSNLSLSGEGNGTIKPDAQPKIVLYINDALLELYSRFLLKEDTLLLTLRDDITFYHLLPRFAENFQPTGSDDDEPIRYIIDMPEEPFLGDVIKVTKVFDSDGRPLALNDVENSDSVFTPQNTVLQVPNPVSDAILSVQYQARHVKLTGDMDELIELPDVLYRALRLHVASSVYSHMNTQDSMSKGQEHLASFERLCQKILDGDLVGTSTSTSNTRFERNGWV